MTTGTDWDDPQRDTEPPTGAEMWAAIEFYAGRGFPMFPIAPRTKLPLIRSPHPKGSPERGKCRGECGLDGHGCYDGTTDLERLSRWWHAYPGALIGFSTGHQFDVLDLDHKVEDDGSVVDGGEIIDQYAEDRAHDWGGLVDPAVMMGVGTPGGGLHLYVAPVVGSGNRAPIIDPTLRGCDWRTFGGLVAAPPSWSAKRGRRYVWAPGHEHREPPVCPPWLASLARRDDRHPVAAQAVRSTTVEMLGGDATPYTAAVIRGCCEDVARAVEGTRNATLNGAAYRAGRFVAGGELREDYARSSLVAAAVACGLAAGYAEDVIGYAFAAAKDTPARAPEGKLAGVA